MAKKKRIRDPRRPQLFSNEDLGLPPEDYEYKEVVITNAQGRKVRQRIMVRTKDSFERQARKIWGDQYDYSESVITHMKAPVTIRCRKHNHYFTVPQAQNHITKPLGRVRPTGCDLCMAEELGHPQKNRGHHIFRTPEQRQREAEEKARRRAERKRAAEERKRAEKGDSEEQALMTKYGVSTVKEARFLQYVHEKYGDQYDTSLAEYVDKDTPVVLICRDHGAFRIKPRVLKGERDRQPHGCWKCCGLPDPYEQHGLSAKRFFSVVETKYRSQNLTFERKRKLKPATKITAICPKHGRITHSAQYWLDGNGCEYCNGKFFPPDFERLTRAAQGTGYQYRGVENIKSTSDRVMVHCGNPAHQWHEMLVWLCLQGSKCRECAGRHQSVEQRCQEWIQKCIDKYGPDRYDYSRAHEDYVNNDSLVWIRCCIHDRWFQQTPDNNLRTVNGSCPVCSAEFQETQGEAAIRRWLLKHDITNFKQDEVTIQHNNPHCRRQYLRPDFWLPDYNLFIEYNGEQHYKEIPHFNDEHWTFQDQQIRDETLRRYCADPQHFHHLLEIPFWEFDNIGSILTSVLIDRKAIPTFEPPQPGEEASR